MQHQSESKRIAAPQPERSSHGAHPLAEHLNRRPQVVQAQAIGARLNAGVSSASEPLLQLRRRTPLSPAAAANRQHLLDRRARRNERAIRIMRAEEGIREMLDPTGERDGAMSMRMFPFPFDVGPGENHAHAPPKNTRDAVKDAPLDDVIAAMPYELRRSSSFRDILAIQDTDHQTVTRAMSSKAPVVKGPSMVTPGKLQEAIVGWFFAKQTGLRNVRSGGKGIDFAGEGENGTVPFDPFLSPQGHETYEAWRESGFEKHVRGKGGNPDTVGVWDQTYTGRAKARALEESLAARGDHGQRENLFTARVPLARMIAEEHVSAEMQGERELARRQSDAEARRAVERRFHKSQARKPKEQRTSLEAALLNTGQQGDHWRRQLAEAMRPKR